MDAVLRRDDIQAHVRAHGRAVVLDAVREVVAAMRETGGAKDGGEALAARVTEAVSRRTRPTLRRVINATGVVVHTNLGRAPLSAAARVAVDQAAGRYTTLEYDLERGKRGSRSSRLDQQLAVLFPGRASLAVNNNAAAVLLALRALASGRDVILSRGELVEIGGSFRVPDMMAESGATLREVGTTNRTRLSDYESALGARTGMLLKVHPSNYRVVGFTQEATVRDLGSLARRHGIPLMVDQGSGLLRKLAESPLRDEPSVEEMLNDGADLVTFSGDKLLGGPQAGLAVGRADLIDTMRRSPLYRVLRPGKMTLAALEETLASHARGAAGEEVPVLRALCIPPETLAARARSLSGRLAGLLPDGTEVGTIEGASRAGGGSAPGEDLPTTLVRLRPAPGSPASVAAWEAALRAAPVPVIARVHEDALWIDPRTVDPDEEDDLVEMTAWALDRLLARAATDPSGCA